MWTLTDEIKTDYRNRKYRHRIEVSIVKAETGYFVQHTEESDSSRRYVTFYTTDGDLIESCTSNLYLRRGLATEEAAVCFAKEIFGIKAVGGGMAIYKQPILEACGLWVA